MAVIVELVDRIGEFIVVSHSGRRIGYIRGADTEWRWSLYGALEIAETSLPRSKTAVLREVARFAREFGSEDFEQLDLTSAGFDGSKDRG